MNKICMLLVVALTVAGCSANVGGTTYDYTYTDAFDGPRNVTFPTELGTVVARGAVAMAFTKVSDTSITVAGIEATQFSQNACVYTLTKSGEDADSITYTQGADDGCRSDGYYHARDTVLVQSKRNPLRFRLNYVIDFYENPQGPPVYLGEMSMESSF